jgi:hypothetical protein
LGSCAAHSILWLAEASRHEPLNVVIEAIEAAMREKSEEFLP